MNGYDLSRNWFNWAFENPEKVKPIHSAIFFFAVEHQNRLGGKDKFGFPSQMTMDAIGVKKYQTYGKALKDLCDWGFIVMVEKSKNQYSANIISLVAPPKKGIARGKALDKATIKHRAKQGQSTGQSKDSINKPLTKEPINQEPEIKTSPYALLEKEIPQQLETWLMQNKKNVTCFDDLVDAFNNTAMIEILSDSKPLEFNTKLLFFRFKNFANSWVRNQKEKPKKKMTKEEYERSIRKNIVF